MLTVSDMNQRLGFGPGYNLLWVAQIEQIIGVPHRSRSNTAGGGECTWTEEDFREIVRRLRDRCNVAIMQSEEDDEL